MPSPLLAVFLANLETEARVGHSTESIDWGTSRAEREICAEPGYTNTYSSQALADSPCNCDSAHSQIGMVFGAVAIGDYVRLL